jgi:hypothetical protein
MDIVGIILVSGIAIVLVVYCILLICGFVLRNAPTVQRNIRKFEARPDKTFMQQVREEYRERRKGE